MIQIFPLIGGAVSIFNILTDYLETLKRPKTDLNVKNCKGRHSPSLFFFLCFEKKVRESVLSCMVSNGFDVLAARLTFGYGNSIISPTNKGSIIFLIKIKWWKFEQIDTSDQTCWWLWTGEGGQVLLQWLLLVEVWVGTWGRVPGRSFWCDGPSSCHPSRFSCIAGTGI